MQCVKLCEKCCTLDSFALWTFLHYAQFSDWSSAFWTDFQSCFKKFFFGCFLWFFSSYLFVGHHSNVGWEGREGKQKEGSSSPNEKQFPPSQLFPSAQRDKEILLSNCSNISAFPPQFNICTTNLCTSLIWCWVGVDEDIRGEFIWRTVQSNY